MMVIWVGHFILQIIIYSTVTRRDENSILRRVMELEVEGRRPVGRPKKTWSKVLEEDTRKLNIKENMTKNRKQ